MRGSGERTDTQGVYLSLPSVNADTSQLVVGAGVLGVPLKKVGLLVIPFTGVQAPLKVCPVPAP